MPKFIATSGSYFQPFSYDQLVKPIAQVQEAHNAAQDAYDQLNLETSALERYLSENPEEDVLAKQLYNDYRKKLETLQNNLWERGITSQTRRDLAAARSSYASDISRLSAAIKARQDRSKEYWDIKHKNPDMIMSDDPALSGLDPFIMDSTYGQDFYSYSGEKLSSEVAADAQSRMKELFSEPIYEPNAKVPGLITKITKTGASSDEVYNAISAARNIVFNDTDKNIATLKLTDTERTLADILLSHIDAIGAKGNVSSDEYARAFEYAAEGLSHAIGQTSYDDIRDPNYVASSKAKRRKGYSFNRGFYSITSPEYTRLQEESENKTKLYSDDKTVGVTVGNNSMQMYDNPWDASEAMYNNDTRRGFRSQFGGLDVGVSPSKKQEAVVYTTGDNKKAIKVFTGELSSDDAKRLGITGDTAIYTKDAKGKDVLVASLTKVFNAERNKYTTEISSNTVQNSDAVFTPDEMYDLYKELGLDSRIDPSDAYSVLSTQALQGEYAPATLAGDGPVFDRVRKEYASAMVNNFDRSNGTLNVYKVDGTSGVITDEKIDSLSDVLGKTSDGTVDGGSLRSIDFLPQDIAVGASRRFGGNGEVPKFRFLAKDNNIYAADVSLLGNVRETLFTPLDNQGRNACDITDYMLMPFLHPQETLMQNDAFDYQWMQYMSDLSNSYGFEIPYISLGNNRYRYATPKEIVRNPAFREKLYLASIDFLDSVLAVPRDALNLDNMQRYSDTSTNASPYNVNEQE